jgi:uncharacterized protein DUF5662
MRHWRYAKYLARHKWFVFVAGLRLGVPLWRLIIHDWSKLLPCEWFPYVKSFYGLQPRSDSTKRAFDQAWLHHQHFNPHHWQHWVLREDSGDTKLLEMPENFVREMVADWCGAGRAITGKWEVGVWYRKNALRIQMNPATTLRVLELISDWEREP